MNELIDLQLRIAHDGLAVSGSGTIPSVGIPNVVKAQTENPYVLSDWSVYKDRTVEEVGMELGLELPVNAADGLDDNKMRLFDGAAYYFETGYKPTIYGTVEQFHKEKVKFIYPINIYHRRFFSGPTFQLNQNILECIADGYGKVVLMSLAEGDPYDDRELKWLTEFSNRNGLNKYNLYFLTGNLYAPKIYKDYCKSKKIEEALTFLPSYHFEDNPWFIQGDKWDFNARGNFWAHAEKLQFYRPVTEYKKHFLCYQRRPRDFRVWTYAKLFSNKKISKNLTMSLGSVEDSFHAATIKNHLIAITDPKKHHKARKALIDLDLFKPHEIDEPLNINQADSINLEHHTTHFLSIVSETWCSERTMFFTEKIFKPIYMLQPFILIGTKGMLQELRKLGYRTFSSWWSEEYDNCDTYVDRIDAIEKILEEISTWDNEKLVEVYKQMEQDLVHNFKVLMSLERYHNTLKLLSGE